MEALFTIIRKKPLFFLVTISGYLIITTLFKWKFTVDIGIILYLLGGITGIFALDFAEAFFHLQPSPLRSILFLAVFPLVAFFVISSSGSLFASGLVLAIFLTLLLWQAGELYIHHSLASWYRIMNYLPPLTTQRLVFVVQIVIFVVITYLFTQT